MKTNLTLLLILLFSHFISLSQTEDWNEVILRENPNPMEVVSHLDEHENGDVVIQTAVMPNLMSLPKTSYEISFYHFYAKELIESRVYVSSEIVYQKALCQWLDDTTLTVCLIVPSVNDSLFTTMFGFKGGSGIIKNEEEQ